MMRGVRVLDFTTGIAGGYCTKLLAAAGADVVKVEPDGGDELRRHRSGGLFEYLHQGKRFVTEGASLLAQADVVVTGDPARAATWHETHSSLVVVSITAFGADGPWMDRPATEFTLQAACGSLGSRGLPEEAPIAVGGRIGEWITGTYAAVGAAAAVGLGERPVGSWVDVAMLDCMAVTLTTYPSVFASFFGWPPVSGTGRTVEVPSIEPTKDGYVVFTTNSAQQFQDFLVLIEKPEWLGDRGLARANGRFARRAEFLEAVRAWTSARTSDEVLEAAALLRIPAGPVLNGSNVAEFEQFVARGVFEPAPSGRFRQPRAPYRIEPAPPLPAPAPVRDVGADDGQVRWEGRARRHEEPQGSPGRPLQGVRVLDCTAWWAGPSATHVLASLGADVVKVESVTKPDLMRLSSTRPPSEDGWWEWGPIFHAVNSSKRGITIDLSRAEGVGLFEGLAGRADLVVENFTPRVMENFGLGWERLREVNPRLVMLRMPAFGLDGPWRDRTGFAQTMECISGMAWVTGRPEGPPVLPRGVCDPIAGLHAALAAVAALRLAREDGRGRLVEVTMVEAALAVTAEQLLAWDLEGRVLGRARDGAGDCCPQGVYRCAGDDTWLAMSVVTEAQWEALCRLVGIVARPEWATAEGRHAAIAEIDLLVSAWSAPQEPGHAVGRLLEAGIPAAEVINGRDVVSNPQLRHRRLFESEDHPVTGPHELPTMPFRMSGVASWMTRPAPTLGQHNDEVLAEVAGDQERAELRALGVIGETLAAGR